MGGVLGWIAGSLLRIRRRHVEASMDRAGIAPPGRAASSMYRALGMSLVEFLRLAVLPRAPIRDVAIDPGSERRWRAAIALGRGLVLAASHTGNWDLAACAVARDVEILVVTKRLRVQALDRVWQRTRARRGVLLTTAEQALRGARQIVRRGGAVAMMIDQVPHRRRHALRADFLGAPAWVDRAPATFAARSGAPFVVTAARRDESGRHVLHVLDVLVPPPRAGRDWIEAATIGATRALEAFVHRHPSQWLWLHRRWRDPRPAAAVDLRRGEARIEWPCKTPSSSPDDDSRAA